VAVVYNLYKIKFISIILLFYYFKLNKVDIRDTEQRGIEQPHPTPLHIQKKRTTLGTTAQKKRQKGQPEKGRYSTHNTPY
jgi:hypothetical protein